MQGRDSEDVWSRFVFELVIWPKEVTLVSRTQPSGPLCLWQCLYILHCLHCLHHLYCLYCLHYWHIYSCQHACIYIAIWLKRYVNMVIWLYVPQSKKWEWKCDITLKPKMQKKNFFFAFLVSNPYDRVSRLPQCVPFFCHTTGTLIIKNKIKFYSPWEAIAVPRLHNERPFLKRWILFSS